LGELEEKYPGEARVVRDREVVQSMINARMARIPGQIRQARERFGERKYDEVVRLMDEVLRWDPENRDAKLLRSLAAESGDLIRNALETAEEWYEAGLLDEAADAVDLVLQADPNHRGARQLQARIAAARKR
jgi:hypothetical protein